MVSDYILQAHGKLNAMVKVSVFLGGECKLEFRLDEVREMPEFLDAVTITRGRMNGKKYQIHDTVFKKVKINSSSGIKMEPESLCEESLDVFGFISCLSGSPSTLMEVFESYDGEIIGYSNRELLTTSRFKIVGDEKKLSDEFVQCSDDSFVMITGYNIKKPKKLPIETPEKHKLEVDAEISLDPELDVSIERLLDSAIKSIEAEYEAMCM